MKIQLPFAPGDRVIHQRVILGKVKSAQRAIYRGREGDTLYFIGEDGRPSSAHLTDISWEIERGYLRRDENDRTNAASRPG